MKLTYLFTPLLAILLALQSCSTYTETYTMKLPKVRDKVNDATTTDAVIRAEVKKAIENIETGEVSVVGLGDLFLVSAKKNNHKKADKFVGNLNK